MRILFGVLSSKQSSEAVRQLAEVVGSRHDVLVHHDYSKEQDFHIAHPHPHLHIVDDYVRSDWGGWGQVEALVKLIRVALADFQFDYFQLLSETCLPIKPISSFEAYLIREEPDICIETLPLDHRDTLALLNYGFKYFGRNRLEKTLIRRISKLGLSPVDEHRRSVESGGLILDARRDENLFSALALRTVLHITEQARKSLFDGTETIYCGSTWFCASRRVLERMIRIHDANPPFVRHFRTRAQNIDEGYFPTIAMLAEPKIVRRFHHLIRWKQKGNGPDTLTIEDYPLICESSMWFARKFSLSPSDALRQKVLYSVGP